MGMRHRIEESYDDKVERLRAQLDPRREVRSAREAFYGRTGKMIRAEERSYAPKENWEESVIVEENLNYELYGKESKLGQKLQRLEWDVSNYESLGETMPILYSKRKKRLNKFKEQLSNFEAEL
jgi:hypothetical protein